MLNKILAYSAHFISWFLPRMQRFSNNTGESGNRWWSSSSGNLKLPLIHTSEDAYNSLASCPESSVSCSRQSLEWLTRASGFTVGGSSERFWNMEQVTFFPLRCEEQGPSAFTVFRKDTMATDVSRLEFFGQQFVNALQNSIYPSPIIPHQNGTGQHDEYNKGWELMTQLDGRQTYHSSGFNASNQSLQDHTTTGCAQEQDLQSESCSRAPFGCNDCKQSFQRSAELVRHARVHPGAKPYSCNVCQRKFSRVDHLRTHEGTHRGEKPFKCAWCPYAATRQDMLTRHTRTRGCGKLARPTEPAQNYDY